MQQRGFFFRVGSLCCSVEHCLWNHHRNLHRYATVVNGLIGLSALPAPLPLFPKEKALSSLSPRNLEGIKTKVPKLRRPNPDVLMKSLFHTWVCLHLMRLATLWMGRGRKWRGGSQLISLSRWGLLNSSRSLRSAEGIAKAPLCMIKPGLIQIFIRAERGVFPVFTSQKEFSTFFSLKLYD